MDKIKAYALDFGKAILAAAAAAAVAWLADADWQGILGAAIGSGVLTGSGPANKNRRKALR